MGDHRMFTTRITEADAFTELPPTTQCLYFHLCMSADDDGFTNHIRSSMFNAHADTNDFELLTNKRFIIPFETGVVVIKHWKMHNIIRSDRKHDTQYVEELSRLVLKENGVYSERGYIDNQLTTTCQPTDNQVTPEVKLSKDKLSKGKLSKENKERVAPVVYFPNDENLNQAFVDYVKMRKQIKAPMTDKAIVLAISKLEKLSGGDNELAIEILNQSIMNSWKGLFEVKKDTKSGNKAGGIDWDNI